MAQLSFLEALKDALRVALQSDPQTIIMGEDIGILGGSFGVTRGLMAEFGARRIIETPISEAGFVGVAVGAALEGLRPIVEIQFCDLLMLCMDQIVNQAAKLHYISAGQNTVPLVIRSKYGIRPGRGPSHVQALHGMFMQVPGLKVICPSTPYDAKGLMLAAIRDQNPVLVMESQTLYAHKGEVPAGDYMVPIGKAAIALEGTDVTLLTCSGMYLRAMEAAKQLATEGIKVEVVDLRSVLPLDKETILESVNKTRKAMVIDEGPLSGGLTSEVGMLIMENLFDRLTAPVVRLGAAAAPPPYAPVLAKAMLPSLDDICNSARRLCAKKAS